uniref:Major urinary protein-like isoform X2 n=1 Tax=Phascolarctos cinereus TaxID=38626 RepID=A0A6P5JSF6_PHACI|nr:major urinary protein-like isoform X2 [Phascolarctos cinereus]
MKILLLTVGLALVCGLQALDNNTEGSPKIDEEWFTVALASNVTSKIEKGGSFRKYIKSVSDHHVFLSSEFLKRANGKCIQFTLNTSIGEDGEMRLQHDGLNNLSIQSRGPGYMMVLLNNIKDEEVTVLVELYGRTPDLPDEIKKKFEEICEKFGIREDQIIDISSDDRCEELRNS